MSNKALWISRHPMDAEAVEQIKNLFDVDSIDSRDFAFTEDPVKALDELEELTNGYRVFGGVFPAQVWYSLVNSVLLGREIFKGKTLFLLVSKNLGVENGVRKFGFDHLEFLNL